MARRAAKKDGTSTLRLEKDLPEVLSGFYEGRTTGTPLAAVIFNAEQHSADYNNISHIARPAHADYTGFLRYNGANDPQLPDENAALRIVLGIVFLVYGLMRGYSTWMKFKANDQ